MKDDEKQQKMIELHILNQQGEQLKQHLEHLTEQMANLRQLGENLEAIENEKEGKKMYSPLSSGVFVQTELKDNKEVLVGIGAGVVVKKSIKDTKDMLKEQEKKMELIIMQIQNEFEKFISSAANLEKELSEAQ